MWGINGGKRPLVMIMINLQDTMNISPSLNYGRGKIAVCRMGEAAAHPSIEMFKRVDGFTSFNPSYATNLMFRNFKFAHEKTRNLSP